MMDNREIDMLIAEKVMEWKWMRSVPGHKFGDGSALTDDRVRAFLVNPTDDSFIRICELIDDDGKYPRICGATLPYYSTDISTAWQVIQKMQADGWHYEIGDMHNDPSHLVKFGRGKYNPYDNLFDEEHSATAPTPWLAICLAALEAVGVDIGRMS